MRCWGGPPPTYLFRSVPAASITAIFIDIVLDCHEFVVSPRQFLALIGLLMRSSQFFRCIRAAVLAFASIAWGLLLFAGSTHAIAGLQLPMGVATFVLGFPSVTLIGPLYWLLPQADLVLHRLPAWAVYCFLMWSTIALNWIYVLPRLGHAARNWRSKSRL